MDHAPLLTALSAQARRKSLMRTLFAAFVLVLTGVLAYRVSEHIGLQNLRIESAHRLDLFTSAADGVVNRYAHLPAIMELNGEVASLLDAPADAARIAAANRYLERLNARTGTIALFILDPAGHVLVSSNWQRADSFVGEDLSFRDYYRDAAAGRAGRHFAIGTTRSDPGYFVSHPVMREGRLLGITVIKIGLDGLRDTWRSLGTPGLIADANGVVILASSPDWLYTALAPIQSKVLDQAERSRLYNNHNIGEFPFPVDGSSDENGTIVRADDRVALAGNAPSAAHTYLVLGRPLPDPGWRALIFSDLRNVRNQAQTHAALAVFATAFLVLLGAFVNQRRRITIQRLETQSMLEKANVRLEETVARRTADLTEANERLRTEIAEREQAEVTLRAAQDELVQAAKLAVLGQMATGITHELTQPLGAIRTLAGNAQEFQRRGAQESVAKNLGIIARLADQMGGIIAPLKTFARKSPAVPVAVDVALAVGNALFLLDARLKKAGVQVINRCRPAELIAWCDQNRLEQVLVNLFDNAADAMALSEVRTLTIEAGAAGGQGLALNVTDSGPGLTALQRNRLFEPFFTTKPVGEGLGLGLAISRDIMRDFGGELSAGEAPGGGARFRLHLPACPEERPA